ncbi:YhcN/YlaJ family sporulation lipoprotein [Caldisalinibacter kiritimatiensis]|uniref:Sporulation lipoprotein, YhcN/YlaJ family n=1 Tax=Caldisalinibacter kiritimatiensis TaxID=1304284 RepID=R1AWI9_9FIRM|nr:YhcN/YlaJ family sporulation lipoprotein [Caldisalinibacter kiritimatiensis]EOD01528.1 hypothetical protein L21TH_0383 [Caldisalinibacter kiritimatiensis]
MKKYTKLIAVLSICLITMSIIMIGCQPQEKPAPPNNYNNNQNPDTDYENDIYFDENMDNKMSNRADKIANAVARMGEVNRATVVVNDNTAIVGVNMENNMEGTMNNDLRQRIERTVKNTDNKITSVAITTDPNLYSRIDSIARNIRDGEDMTGYRQDIQEIMMQISPGM